MYTHGGLLRARAGILPGRERLPLAPPFAGVVLLPRELSAHYPQGARLKWAPLFASGGLLRETCAPRKHAPAPGAVVCQEGGAAGALHPL